LAVKLQDKLMKMNRSWFWK